MVTVRNASAAPISLGALKLAPGEVGSVEETRPGVRMLVESKRLVVVEGSLRAPDVAAENIALKTENVALRNERDGLLADVARLTAMVDALGNGQAKPAVTASVKVESSASPEGFAQAIDNASKPSKKGGN